jgi:hypothetical protein
VRRVVALAAAGAVVLLTGVRLWPQRGLGPWADLLTDPRPDPDRVVLWLHVAGGIALIALVGVLLRSTAAAVLVAATFATGYLVDSGGGWFAYAPNTGLSFSPASGGARWAVVHAMVVAPIAASVVAYVLGRRQAVEEPPGTDDVGAG